MQIQGESTPCFLDCLDVSMIRGCILKLNRWWDNSELISLGLLFKNYNSVWMIICSSMGHYEFAWKDDKWFVRGEGSIYKPRIKRWKAKMIGKAKDEGGLRFLERRAHGLCFFKLIALQQVSQGYWVWGEGKRNSQIWRLRDEDFINAP